ncbi:Pyruvate formate-lyase 1-activating enzyme [bacterium HR13]|nr:Pyruvate formate-lyase 1-activating enzyme [bacterium HR13]
MMRDYEERSVKGRTPHCLFKIGGFQRFTLIDYPGKVSCIVFTQGCNFRCPYCYNVELVLPEYFGKTIPEEEILSFLEQRVGKLEGVVITGGEPTIHAGLKDFIEKVKKLSFSVKLDTNGSMPEVIEELIKDRLVDYIAMDIKAPPDKYEEVVRAKVNIKAINRSINLIMNSGVDYEFRTTVVKDQLSKDDILKIAEWIKGAKRYYLQKFLPGKTLDPDFSSKTTYSDEEFAEILSFIKDNFSECALR